MDTQVFSLLRAKSPSLAGALGVEPNSQAFQASVITEPTQHPIYVILNSRISNILTLPISLQNPGEKTKAPPSAFASGRAFFF